MIFLEEFNKLTDNRYGGCLVKSAVYNINKNKLALTLLFPEKFYKHISGEDRKIILKAGRQLVNNDIWIDLFFEYSFSDPYIIKNKVFDFLNFNEPLYIRNIRDNDVEIKIIENKFLIKIKINTVTYSYFKSSNLEGKLKKYLSNNFTQDAKIILEKDSSKDVDYDLDSMISIDFTRRGDRHIKIKTGTPIIGKTILGLPNYIVDLKPSDKQALVVCGKVKNIIEKYIEKIDKNLIKFQINDSTEDLNAVVFEKVDSKRLEELNEGDEVVLQGRVQLNSYDNKLQIMPNRILNCEIDYSSINLEPIYKNANAYYMLIHPEPYVENTQMNLFTTKKVIPEVFKNKTFVVFDLETTGLDSMTNKITEIGAVKLENGKFTEVFSTLVNPKTEISEKITKITGITNEMVENAPTIEEVFPDFYKFIGKYPLVAHNISFDIGFVNAEASRQVYKVDNKLFDTLEIAKKNVKTSQYNLGALCRLFGVELSNAHRACYDAVACGELFMKFAEYL